MAYGNWGAFVYKNGERMRNHEDATPYKEQEFESGYSQVFMSSKGCNPHHAVLGEKDVRLTGYKHIPMLFVKGERVDIEKYKQVTDGDNDYGDSKYYGEIDGYKFEAEQYDGNMVKLKLIEPDGTIWESTCGYGYGAGHMD
jgi:hypothetical protein